MHSANWDISISVVIDNSVPEKSFKSVIMDNVAQISQISEIVRTILPSIPTCIVIYIVVPKDQ